VVLDKGGKAVKRYSIRGRHKKRERIGRRRPVSLGKEGKEGVRSRALQSLKRRGGGRGAKREGFKTHVGWMNKG